MADEVNGAYDELADVLYICVGTPDRRARSQTDERGLVWRTSPDGLCRAVTIHNFGAWTRRLDELEALVAERLHTAREIVHERMLEVA